MKKSMNKSTVLAMVATMMMVSSVGFASPQTDYSAGKTSIDVMYRNSDLATKNSETNDSFDKKANLDFGITAGLGNKFAVQYNGYNAKSKATSFPNDDGSASQATATLKTQQFNVLYQLDKNLSVFTGFVSAKGQVNADGDTYTSESKNKVQFGLIGSTKLADKTTAYAKVGFASDFTDMTVGLSQEISPNLEFNVDYRKVQAKKLTFDGGADATDVTAKGIGFGVTYKF